MTLTETRAVPPHAVRVYQWAVLKGDLPPQVVNEIRLAHDLRNHLVSLEHAHQDAVKQVWETHPQIAKAAQAAEQAAERCREAAQAAADERQRTRKKAVSAETAAAVKEAKAALAAAKNEVKRLKKELYPVIKTGIEEARTQRKGAVKAAYAEYVSRGLYWASINNVTSDFETAAKRVAAARKKGMPAGLRFHRWDGSGTIAVQLQRGSSDPPRGPEILASGQGPWRHVAQILPRDAVPQGEPIVRARPGQRYVRDRPEDGLVRLRIGSGDRKQIVTMPVVIHRPLPPGVDVTMLLLTRTRVASRWTAAVSVVVREPAPEPRVEGSLVGLHLGWRALDDGSIRVGVAAGFDPSTMPAGEEMACWLRGYGSWAEIVLPAEWRRAWSRLDGVQSRRDQAVEVLRAWLAERLDEHEWLGEALGVRGSVT
ncbi:MAG TPA: hypothetical protein VIS29_19790, partial [Streptomyces sp.]